MAQSDMLVDSIARAVCAELQRDSETICQLPAATATAKATETMQYATLRSRATSGNGAKTNRFVESTESLPFAVKHGHVVIEDAATQLIEKQKDAAAAKTKQMPIKRSGSRKGRQTAGPGWFNMPKQTLPRDLLDPTRNLLKVINNRQYLDPKRFYKKEKYSIPQYFHVGRVIAGPADRSWMTRHEANIPPLQAAISQNDTSRNYLKRKFNEVQKAAKPQQVFGRPFGKRRRQPMKHKR